MSAPRVYRGAFCTGHTPMVGTVAIQFTENAMHEFIEEYKQANGMYEKKGPGLAKAHDFRDEPQRPSPPLPMSGCALARLETGNFASRQAPTSSKAVGSWYTDPIFQNSMKETVKPPSKAAPASQGISTTSDLGSFWWDPQLSEKDPVMDKKRSENGIKRLLPVESGSQFALENLPIGDRLL